jgi:hypothetical protein
MNIEKFKDKLIAFDYDNEMVNATDMLKAFPEKRMNNFLRQKQTIEYISILENHLKSDTQKSVSKDIQILKVIKGNSNNKIQGTWMHKLLAYKFAAWLNPEFELFVYRIFDKVIKEKMDWQQRQLDYFWDREDIKDLYGIK